MTVTISSFKGPDLFEQCTNRGSVSHENAGGAATTRFTQRADKAATRESRPVAIPAQWGD
jgi:hypothetical protein